MVVRGIIKYNGTTIADFSGSGSIKTLVTNGKLMDGNITVELKEGLPSGYTQLEYLQSTGLQHINTGFTTGAKYWVDTEVSFDKYYANYTFIFGVWASLSIGTNKYNLVFGSGGTESNPDSHTITIGQKYRYVFGQKRVLQDGVSLWSSTTANNTASGTLYLFSNNYFWQTNVYSYGKIYYLKLYDGTFNDTTNSNLLASYIPAKNSSGTLGMYDTVSSKFLTNDGSGTFIAGPDYEEEL